MRGQRGGLFAALAGRFSPAAPATETQPTSTGARTLLAAAARNGELAIHAVRGLLWILLFLAVSGWLGVPAVAAAVAGVVLGGLWLLAQMALESGRNFAVWRYGLMIFDGLVVLAAIASREPGSGLALLAGAFARAPAPADVQPFIPVLLVFIALSGAARIDLRAAFITTAIAASAYAYYAVALRISAEEAIFVGAVILLAGFVGMNAARVMRLILLKAQQQAVLEAFLPDEVARSLTTGASLERLGRLEEVTLLTCDVRGFTKMSELLTPVETVAFVNRYLDEVCPAIVGAGGVIDKFMGDGVLAFFEGGGHAGRALQAARGIAAAGGRVKGPTGDRIKVGVAIHSGVVLVGTIGPRSRREYTIISDTVNTLSRLEELNKTFGSVICASDRTLSEVPAEQRSDFLGPETIPVRGRAEPVIVHYYKAPETQAELEKAAEPPPPPPAAEPVAAGQPEIQYWKD